MRKISVYLDTSVISSYFDERVPESRSHTRRFFDSSDTFEIFVSDLVIAEIGRTKDEQRKHDLQELAGRFASIPLSDEALSLAEDYMINGAVPAHYREDALHIALAVVHGVDFLLSWNFEHLVRIKTRKIVEMVHAGKGYPLIQIATPAELI